MVWIDNVTYSNMCLWHRRRGGRRRRCPGQEHRGRVPFQAGPSYPGSGVGPDHPDVAETLENYAALLHKIGRGAAADKLEARAKAIRAKYE